MVKGKFTSIINLKDGLKLVYNSLNDKFIIVKANKLDENLINAEDYPSVFADLVDSGALVNSHEEETQKLKNRLFTNINQKECYKLIVNPTLGCNFHCWYCYESHDNPLLMTSETISSVINLIKNVINDNPGLRIFQLSFFGGEPLLGFEKIAKPIIDAAERECNKAGICLTIHFTTNGFLLTSSMFEFFKDKEISFQITLDGDKEAHDKVRSPGNGKGSYDVILRNIGRLAQIGAYTVVRVNYNQDNIDCLTLILEDLNKFPAKAKCRIRVDFQAIWQSTDEDPTLWSMNRIGDILAKFKSSGFVVSCPSMHNSVITPCYGDLNHEVLVNCNGDIFKCTARDFHSNNRLGNLRPDGTIDWNGGNIPDFASMRWSREYCKKCRIAPLCMAGCHTKINESKINDGCPLGRNDKEIDDLILDRFEYFHMRHLG